MTSNHSTSWKSATKQNGYGSTLMVQFFLYPQVQWEWSKVKQIRGFSDLLKTTIPQKNITSKNIIWASILAGAFLIMLPIGPAQRQHIWPCWPRELEPKTRTNSWWFQTMNNMSRNGNLIQVSGRTLKNSLKLQRIELVGGFNPFEKY